MAGRDLSDRAAADGALVEGALTIARDLVSAAARSPGGVSWQAEIVVGIDADAPVVGFGDVGETLYDGAAGIALGLAACATVATAAEAAVFAETARGAATHALSCGPDLLDAGRVGLFDGATGVALAAATVGRRLSDATLLDGAAALARRVSASAHELSTSETDGMELDLIGGLAGTVLGLQNTMHAGGDIVPPALLEAVEGRLVRAAIPQTWGEAWPTGAAAPGGPPLLGLGHGAAGIALALAELAALTAHSDARRACREGLEYERSWYDPDRVAWPDLRGSSAGAEPEGWMSAWCHGAVGIGLSRLRMARLTGDVVCVAEASAALQAGRDLAVSAGTALRAGQESDCTACHGLGGVVELQVAASKALGVPEHASAARRTAKLLLEQRDAAGGAWPCGLPGAGEVPGLMTGTAGIALTLLRAAGAIEISTPLLPGPAGW
jgi:lantibiotic biosynthesis protein